MSLNQCRYFVTIPVISLSLSTVFLSLFLVLEFQVTHNWRSSAVYWMNLFSAMDRLVDCGKGLLSILEVMLLSFLSRLPMFWLITITMAFRYIPKILLAIIIPIFDSVYHKVVSADPYCFLKSAFRTYFNWMSFSTQIIPSGGSLAQWYGWDNFIIYCICP